MKHGVSEHRAVSVGMSRKGYWHLAKNEAMNVAKTNGIPCFMHHSCGVCTFRECIRCLQNLDCAAAGREGSNGSGTVNMGSGMHPT